MIRSTACFETHIFKIEVPKFIGYMNYLLKDGCDFIGLKCLPSNRYLNIFRIRPDHDHFFGVLEFWSFGV